MTIYHTDAFLTTCWFYSGPVTATALFNNTTILCVCTFSWYDKFNLLLLYIWLLSGGFLWILLLKKVTKLSSHWHGQILSLQVSKHPAKSGEKEGTWMFSKWACSFFPLPLLVKDIGSAPTALGNYRMHFDWRKLTHSHHNALHFTLERWAILIVMSSVAKDV